MKYFIPFLNIIALVLGYILLVSAFGIKASIGFVLLAFYARADK